MQFSDSIQYLKSDKYINDILDVVEDTEWIDLGKCTIMPNNAANKIKGNDSEPRIYNYEIIMRKPKSHIPKENEWIHITKKDGTIDTDAQVIGFVTYKGRFLKLWV